MRSSVCARRAVAARRRRGGGAATATGGAADARCWWRGRGRLALAGACCARAPRAAAGDGILDRAGRDRSRRAGASVGSGWAPAARGPRRAAVWCRAAARASPRLVGECDGLTITAATQTRSTSAAPATTRRACPAGLVRAGASGCVRRARPRGARRTTARSSDSAAAPIAAAAGSALTCPLSVSRAACANQSSSPCATSRLVVASSLAAGASTSLKKVSRSSPTPR